MTIQKKIYLFTHKFPQGMTESTFLKFEVSKLCKDFKEIVIIPEKYSKEKLNILKNKKIKINFKLAKKLNTSNFLFYFFTSTIFSLNFYGELSKIILKNFLQN